MWGGGAGCCWTWCQRTFDNPTSTPSDISHLFLVPTSWKMGTIPSIKTSGGLKSLWNTIRLSLQRVKEQTKEDKLQRQHQTTELSERCYVCVDKSIGIGLLTAGRWDLYQLWIRSGSIGIEPWASAPFQRWNLNRNQSSSRDSKATLNLTQNST